MIDLTICRICNYYNGDIPIFHNQIHPSVPEEIFNFSGVTVSELDNFPQKMCQSCLDLLNGCIMFRDMCQKTHKKLIELSVKKEPKVELENDDYFTVVSIDFKASSPVSDCLDEPVYTESSQIPDYTENSQIPDLTTHEKSTDETYLEYCKKPRKRRIKNKDTECSEMEVKDVKKRRRRTQKNADQECDTSSKDIKKPKRRRNRTRRTYVYNFLCDTCGKVCQSIGQLQTHQTTHKNVFPYKCDVCPYRGRTESLLKVHKRSHLADKPYKCTQCPKATTTASNLARHMACFHSAIKRNSNFKCEYCDKTFIYRYRMRRHIEEIHLKTTAAECDVCFKTYTNKKSLLRHRSTAHNLKRTKQGGRLPSYLLVQKEGNLLETDDYVTQPPKQPVTK